MVTIPGVVRAYGFENIRFSTKCREYTLTVNGKCNEDSPGSDVGRLVQLQQFAETLGQNVINNIQPVSSFSSVYHTTVAETITTPGTRNPRVECRGARCKGPNIIHNMEESVT